MKGFLKHVVWIVLLFSVVSFGWKVWAQSPAPSMDEDPLQMPPIGSNTLRVVTPTLLELCLINTKLPDPAQITVWNFVNSAGVLTLPSVAEFVVTADGRPIVVQSVGFKRRPLFAPLIDYPKTINDRDLRISNSIYLKLASPIADNETVEVLNPTGLLWSSNTTFIDTADPMRWSPAIHVNQVGYMPGQSKIAMVGYYLGSFGELDAPSTSFQLINTATGASVFQGQLTARVDVGFTLNPLPYQKVKQADFTAFNTPGEYQLVVPGLGSSFPFFIHDGIAAAGARAYALGMYHQRCGTSLASPHTRHTHGVCHAAAAEIPTASHPTWTYIGQVGQALTPSTILFPYVRQGTIDVSLGHHDAGDYSKYTINSALLIHHLVFAADAMPGVGALDNLGIPESGDGKSDILQEAKHEADFLAKNQDTDGGFYFLVYPRARKYESNVTPDNGDIQVVWPKQTAVTASAVAALAETGSSPLFKQQFPAEAALYLQKAQLGWQFLENAIATYGKAGCYQKVTHYGDVFTHDDELAWAASAMFAATGNAYYQQKLKEWVPDPNAASVRRWGWWRLFEGYGGAIRTYAFAVRSGRLDASQVDAAYLAKCENEVKLAGQDQLIRARDNAYGTSFPNDSKRNMAAGWYFSAGQAFDLAAAHVLDPNPGYIEAIITNLNFEFGCNPVNMTFVTGTGWKHQRDIVSQFAKCDIRVLPPSGIPTGNLQEVFQYQEKYPELRSLAYPPDVKTSGGYHLYDRWCDTWNVNTEAVVVDQAKGLGCLAYLMARSPLASQSWNSSPAQITGLPAQGAVSQAVTATVNVPGMDLTNSSCVWESKGQEPHFGRTFTFAPSTSGSQWVEVEVVWPDGRRAFAQTAYQVGGGTALPTVTVTASDASASETGPNNGAFTFTRTGSTSSALTVRYALSGSASNGTDYTTLTGVMTIPAGAASATVTLVPAADSSTEGTETAIATISSDAAYTTGSPNSASISIADASSPPPTLPTVTVSATDAGAGETGPNNGTFTITRTGATASSLVVNYGMSGTASNGSDYASLSGSATIPAGSSTATVTVTPNADAQVEGTESAILTLSANASYQIGSPSSASVSITDAAQSNLPVVTVAIADGSAAEKNADPAKFQLNRTGSTAASLTVYYALTGTAINGTDYKTLKNNVTFPAGSASVNVKITPLKDSLAEGAETVILTLSAGTGYQAGAVASGGISIADASGGTSGSTVSISATDAAASESGDTGTFRFTRTGSTASSMVVSYSISGTATPGTDCQWLSGAWQNTSGTVTIPAGSASTTISVVPIADSVSDPNEKVTVTVSSNSGYTVGSPAYATVTISETAQTAQTTPSISAIVTDASASEKNADPAMFRLSRTGSTASQLTVYYAMTGAAVNGVDYKSLKGNVTFPEGAATVNVKIVPLTDSLSEGTESVILTLLGGAGYQVASPSSGSASIANSN